MDSELQGATVTLPGPTVTSAFRIAGMLKCLRRGLWFCHPAILFIRRRLRRWCAVLSTHGCRRMKGMETVRLRNKFPVSR